MSHAAVTTPTFIIGDVHGQRERLLLLLHEAGLLNRAGAWAGGDAILWFMGDFCDRGPDGAGVVALVRHLQREATAAGGAVAALLGNHEPLLLAAARFPRKRAKGWGSTFRMAWEYNGGDPHDLATLTPDDLAWLADLPAMARLGDTLLIHADSPLYLAYGDSIAATNAAIRALLAGDDIAAWDDLLGRFTDREAFDDENPGGWRNIERMLATFGGQRIVHGHTPIERVTGLPPRAVVGPYSYAGGRCVNVDGGLYLGGQGFIYRLPDAD
jgi:hypothetical protein